MGILNSTQSHIHVHVESATVPSDTSGKAYILRCFHYWDIDCKQWRSFNREQVDLRIPNRIRTSCWCPVQCISVLLIHFDVNKDFQCCVERADEKHMHLLQDWHQSISVKICLWSNNMWDTYRFTKRIIHWQQHKSTSLVNSPVYF